LKLRNREVLGFLGLGDHGVHAEGLPDPFQQRFERALAAQDAARQVLEYLGTVSVGANGRTKRSEQAQ